MIITIFGVVRLMGGFPGTSLSRSAFPTVSIVSVRVAADFWA